MNQIRMNQSLNEFMKSMQRTSNRSLAANADASLDITSLDEDLTDRSAGQVLDGSSTTAEFKKYLDDLKKNYLEKLTFSCPSKPTRSALRSLENNELSYGALAGANMSTRRSLYFDSKQEDIEEKPSHTRQPQLAAFKTDTLDKQMADTTGQKQLDKIHQTVIILFDSLLGSDIYTWYLRRT